MKEIVGSVLGIAGLVGIVFFGYKYMNDSESFELFGADIVVSTGDYIPILMSVIVFIAGVVIYWSKDK